MRAFVTGASGHIGSALVSELLAAGHQVLGLARSAASASALEAAGAQVRRGDLDDLVGLREAARDADGVVHLAYKHDLALAGSADGFVVAAQHDVRAIAAIGDALAGSHKPFVITSGTALLGLARPGVVGTEADTLPGGPRIDSENATVALAERGVRSSVVRLPPTVHSSLDRSGFVPSLIAMARRNGFSAYVGEGQNRWPAVHTRDAARLYRLALESTLAGVRLHATAEEGVPFRAIAEAIGRGCNLPTRSISADEAGARLGFLGHFVQVDNPTSSEHTRELLRWQPQHADLIADLAEPHYFA